MGNGVPDADFQPPFSAGSGSRPPGAATSRDAIAPPHADGSLPDYPLGSDFTPVEQRLVKALGWLKSATGTVGGKLRTVQRAVVGGGTGAGAGRADAEALARMGLQSPQSPAQRLEARLLALGLRETAGG